MNYGIIVYMMGWIFMCIAGLLLVPTIVALIYAESVWPLLGTALAAAVMGFACLIRKPKSRVFYLREGFVITSMSWIVISLVGAIPFVVSGSIPSYIDALFETMSGFTTTGASILNDVESLPKSILFWRSFTHWIGGMGVLVFLLTVLPRAGASYTNLMKAESPGPQVEKLVPKIKDTAKILYGIYILLTVLMIVIMAILKTPIFDNLCLSLGTAGTGGFGIKNDSLGSYTAAQQNCVATFMFLFGVNFNFYFFLILRKWKKAVAMEEVRWYLCIVFIFILSITLNIKSSVGSFGGALHQAFFQVGALISSTGFSSVDFDLWPNFSKGVLVLAMLIGACAGSTGGGFKVGRIMYLVKDARRQLKRVLQPNRIINARIDGKAIPGDVLATTNAYLSVYLVFFALSVFIVSFDGYDFTTNFTAVAATLNNIGPGLSMVGPAKNFSCFSAPIKLVLIFDMLAGRLELFPVLIMFSPVTWKKH